MGDLGASARAETWPDWLKRALAAAPAQRRLPEPLELSAPLALDWAETHCGRCRAYHGLWQYRRIAGGVAALGADGAIYQAIIAALRREEGLSRILISATADYALQAVVRDAFRAVGAAETAPQITVADRCATPLLLNAWLAAERGGTVATRQGDLLEMELGGPYDLTISHSLFFWFSESERERLTARWFAALRPGGRVLLSNRVMKAPPIDAKHSTAKLIGELQAAAPLFPPSVLPRLLELAPSLAAVWGGNKVESIAALTGPFSRAGFEIEAVLVANDVLPNMRDVDTLPGRPVGAGKRHLVLARRPG
ncbi:MAG TPA: class I SAM-dependent methyltransferase [Kiloniellales bacterium]|nr:class I SAM-dependent methyltransferase [Kiloniellales bacterium]